MVNLYIYNKGGKKIHFYENSIFWSLKCLKTWNKDHIKNVSKNSFLCSHQEQWQQAWGNVILDMYIKINVFKTKKLSTDLLGNRFRDRSLNIFKTTTGSKSHSLSEWKLCSILKHSRAQGKGYCSIYSKFNLVCDL